MRNLIDLIRNTDYTESNDRIRSLSGIVDYFSSEDEKIKFISVLELDASIVQEDRVSYGDWQTPMSLAEKICDAHLSKFGSPDIVIEPTCGRGAFVFSALQKFQNIKEVYAIDINSQYTSELNLNFP